MENKPTVRNTHSLLSIDPETRTGVCDHCGPAKIAKCGNVKGVQYWGCSFAHLRLGIDGNPKVQAVFTGEVENKSTTRNGHKITSFSAETQAGKCETCGDTTVVKCGGYPGVQYWGCAFAYPRLSATVNINRHFLSDVNPVTRDAVCSECGPTKAIKNGTGGWTCREIGSGAKGDLDTVSWHLHKLTDINEIECTATCAHCGPTRITKGGERDGQVRWKCCSSYKIKKSKHRPNVHVLDKINAENKTGTCRKCGEVSIIKSGVYRGVINWQCLPAFRWTRLHQRYGMSEEMYVKMTEVQGGLCAICHKETELCVDHEHGPNETKVGRITGKVRGLLCRHCNTMLGHAFDSIPVLEAAILYLRHHAHSSGQSSPCDGEIYELGSPDVYRSHADPV